MHEWAVSPFAVPVAAFAMVLGIVIVANISNYHTRKLKSEERMAAIAKGIALPPEPDPQLTALGQLDRLSSLGQLDRLSSAEERASRARGLRTGGIVLISVGVGVSVFGLLLAWIVQEHDVLVVAAAGLIPLVIGVGLLVDYAVRARSDEVSGR
jgi:Flp pilus assembly protein TadB